MQKLFKVGSSREIITPKLGTLLYGYTDKRPASSVLDDLTVNAVAFEKGDVRGIMISADICSVTEEIVDTIRTLINKETNFPKENVSFSAIHTHSGPAIKGSGGWGTANTEYINEILIPRTVTAAINAVKNLTPCVMGVGTTQSLVAINRREYRKDGTIKLGQNPFGACDTTMTVLAFKSLDGKPIVNLVHYGCHGTSAGRTTEITRDWAGVMVDTLESVSGAHTVYFNGSEGDAGPRLSNGETTGDTFDENEIAISSTTKYIFELGNLAGLDATRAYKSIKDYHEVNFNVITGTIVLPYKPIPTLNEAKAKLEALGDPEKLIMVQKREYQALTDTIKMYNENQEFKTQMEIKQVMFLFNSTIFIPFPFELFSVISLRLRKDSPFENTLCTCNTNGSHFYLPIQEELVRGGYEIEVFLYANVYKLKNNTDDTIISENMRLINEFLSK